MKCMNGNIVIVRGKNQSERKGIILPEAAQEESNVGEIICIDETIMSLDVGDTVLVPLLTMMRIRQTGMCDLIVDGKPALVIKEEDIAVVWPKGGTHAPPTDDQAVEWDNGDDPRMN
ncbi:MAG: co-chaperone GroES [Deltaproteobacteria bacterium]|nr:co-chaperone GroES [Deltaproteobacteria bacterium]